MNRSVVYIVEQKINISETEALKKGFEKAKEDRLINSKKHEELCNRVNSGWCTMDSLAFDKSLKAAQQIKKDMLKHNPGSNLRIVKALCVFDEHGIGTTNFDYKRLEVHKSSQVKDMLTKLKGVAEKLFTVENKDTKVEYNFEKEVERNNKVQPQIVEEPERNSSVHTVGCKCGNCKTTYNEPGYEYGQNYKVIECEKCGYYWEGYSGYINPETGIKEPVEKIENILKSLSKAIDKSPSTDSRALRDRTGIER